MNPQDLPGSMNGLISSIRNLPNVLILHFTNLKRDMPGQISKIAKFLDISIDENNWEPILLHCSFDYMRANAPKTVPFDGALWEEGIKSFIYKGINDRWSEILDSDEILKYENSAVVELGDECAHWLATGILI